MGAEGQKRGKEMKIKEMVTQYLINNKYDGLCSDWVDCGCILDDLMPCGEPRPDCFAGYKIACDCDMKCDFHVGEEKQK